MLEIYAAGGPSIQLVSAEHFGPSGRVRAADANAAAYDAEMIAIVRRRRTEAGIELRLKPNVDAVADLAAGDEIVVVG